MNYTSTYTVFHHIRDLEQREKRLISFLEEKKQKARELFARSVKDKSRHQSKFALCQIGLIQELQEFIKNDKTK